RIGADRRLEVGAPDFLLELPEEVDVERDALLDRVAGAEEGRHRGALVVGRTAAPVLVALADEVEGLRFPVGAFGRLDVEVVVDGDRRIVRAAVETAVDDRMALRPVERPPRSGRFEEPDGGRCRAVRG